MLRSVPLIVGQVVLLAAFLVAGIGLSACCPDFVMVATPDHVFDPGFSVEGAYEVYGDGELLHSGSLSEADYVGDENTPLRAIVDDYGARVLFKGLGGMALHGSPEQFQWASVEVFRDGTAIAESDVFYDCKAVQKGCPKHGKVCTPGVLEMGD